MRDLDQQNSRFRVVVGIFMLVLFVGGIWGAVGLVWPDDDGQIVLLKADNAPYKIKPDDKGGMQIPHQDKLIFNTVSSDGKMVTVERILPGPEQPLNNPTNTMDVRTQIAPVVNPPVVNTPADITPPTAQVKSPQATAQIPPPPAIQAPQVDIDTKNQPAIPVPVAMGRVIEAPQKIDVKPDAPKSPTKDVPSKDKDAPVKPAAAFDMSKGEVPKPAVLLTKTPNPEPKLDKEIFKEAPKEVLKEDPKEDASFKGPKPKETASKADTGADEEQVDNDLPANEPVSKKQNEDDYATGSQAVGGRSHFQLASFFDKSSADKGIAQFRSKYAAELQGISLSIAQAKINGNKTVYRIQGSAANADTATSICADIKAKGGSCVLIRP
jgi:hypothetical protein